jgi:hypothetical protein
MAALPHITAVKLVDFLRQVDTHRDMFVRILSEGRLGLGTNPFQPTHVIDLSQETVRPSDPTVLESQSASLPLAPQEPISSVNGMRLSRRRDTHWLQVNGRRIECSSLKELLATALREMEQLRPGTLERLSQLKLRSRRIIAHDRNQLFDHEHLAEKYAEQLLPGWWFGTNNSARETEAWIQRALAYSGLSQDDDFKTDMTITLEQARRRYRGAK